MGYTRSMPPHSRATRSRSSGSQARSIDLSPASCGFTSSRWRRLRRPPTDHEPIDLAANSRPLDIAEALHRMVEVTRAAWSKNAFADDTERATTEATLACWQADLETTIRSLEALGASRGPREAEPEQLAGLRRAFVDAARSATVSKDVIDALELTRGDGKSPSRLLIDLLRAPNGRCAPAASRQTDPFWRVALGTPVSAEGLISTSDEYDSVHVYDSTKEADWDWDTRAKAICA
jgi:hypothetical protein